MRDGGKQRDSVVSLCESLLHFPFLRVSAPLDRLMKVDSTLASLSLLLSFESDVHEDVDDGAREREREMQRNVLSFCLRPNRGELYSR